MVYTSTRSPVEPYRSGAEREGSPSANCSTNQRLQPEAEDGLKKGRLAGGDEEERDDQKGYCWRTGETGEERNGRETRVEDKIEGDRR